MRRDDPARGTVTREEFQQERWFMRRSILATIALAFAFALGTFLAIFLLQRQGFDERARISDEFCATVQNLVAAQIPRDERVASLLADSPSPDGRALGILFEASANFGRRFVAADCDNLPDDLRIPKLTRARARTTTAPNVPAQTPPPSSTTTGAVPAPPPKPRPRKQAPSKTAPAPVPTPAPTPSPPETTPAPGPIPNPVVPSVPVPTPPPPSIRLPCLRLPQLPPIGECA